MKRAVPRAWLLTLLIVSGSTVLARPSPAPRQETASPPGVGEQGHGEGTAKASSFASAVEQLRQTEGNWSVTTEFLNEDGSVARAVRGSYRFQWVVPDRVLSGQSEIPELKQSAGLLFYVNEEKLAIEMVSVGSDGKLWTMTGAAGDEVRFSQPFRGADGKETRLRFTRFGVKAQGFESKMDYTTDGGKTWRPGNHQIFVRAEPPPR